MSNDEFACVAAKTLFLAYRRAIACAQQTAHIKDERNAAHVKTVDDVCVRVFIWPVYKRPAKCAIRKGCARAGSVQEDGAMRTKTLTKRLILKQKDRGA